MLVQAGQELGEREEFSLRENEFSLGRRKSLVTTESAIVLACFCSMPVFFAMQTWGRLRTESEEDGERDRTVRFTDLPEEEMKTHRLAHKHSDTINHAERSRSSRFT